MSDDSGLEPVAVPGYAGGWCIHYKAPPRALRGEEPHVCNAGVNLTERFGGTKFATRPCFLTEAGESRANAEPCEHIRRPTAEEIAAHERWAEDRLNLLRTVMVSIQPWRAKHRGRSFADVVECPVCKGRLHMSIAAYNGHVHGRCETADCVSWME